MLKMESHSSNTSLNISDRDSSSWTGLWSDTRRTSQELDIHHRTTTADLTKVIGDKAVAAKAVAFVVNSTRKGIVAHCADVANLLRVKQSLEDRISHLLAENEALRKYVSESRENLADGQSRHALQTGAHQDLGYMQFECDSDQPSIDGHFNKDNIRSPCLSPASSLSTSASQHNYDNKTPNSLPSSVAEHSFQPVKPAEKTVVRCETEHIRHPIPSPHKLAFEELHRIRKHNSWSEQNSREKNLSSKSDGDSVRSFDSLSLASDGLVTPELSNPKELRNAQRTIDRNLCTNNNNHTKFDTKHLHPHRQNSAPEVFPTTYPVKDSHVMTSFFPSCKMCADVQLSCRNGAEPRIFLHDSSMFYTSDRVKVTLDDDVLTWNNICGTVRYIGHLSGFSSACLFVGLQLSDKVNGGTDGTFNSKRYFSCSHGRGIFVNAQDIIKVVHKKKTSNTKIRKQNSNGASNHSVDGSPSSSSSGGGGGLLSKLRKPINLKHTFSHKRITLDVALSEPDLETSQNTSKPNSPSKTDLPNGLV